MSRIAYAYVSAYVLEGKCACVCVFAFSIQLCFAHTMHANAR